MASADKPRVLGGLLLNVFFTVTIIASASTLGLAAWQYFYPPPHIATNDGFRHVATQMITTELHHPSTAVFAPSDEWTFERRGENKCLMRAWAEAQNELGARVRNHFTILVEHDGVDYWEVKYLKFDESDKVFGRLE